MSETLSISWAPLLPWPLIAALGGAATLILALAMFRRARGVWWRVLAAAALLIALLNPALVREDRDPLADVVLLVIDESASQEIAPRPSQTEETVRHLEALLGGLDETEVRTLRVKDDLGDPEDRGTRLFTALRQAISKVARQRIAAALVVSDGQVHDVPANLEALGIDAPVHLLLTGKEDEGDRRLRITNAPSFGIVGRKLAMTLSVEDLPQSAGGAPARLLLRRDGGEPETMEVSAGREQTIEFELDRRGPTVFEIEAEPGPRELTLANNRATVVINGVRDRLRVLLVSGEPHIGERAWRNILKSDPAVDLVHFTILRPPEKQDGTPIRELSLIAFPTRELFEVKLDDFDLIIFDRYRRRGVLPSLYLENIADYVERGGALFEAVGPTFATPLSLYRTPLGRVLPAEPTNFIYEQGFRPQVTEIGNRHPVTANLPAATNGNGEAEPAWGRWFRHLQAAARGGHILMSGVDDQPLLVLDRVGEGRVAQLLSDHMWLWSRGFESGGPQAELLRRVAHWLMKEPDLEEEDLRASIADGRLEIMRRSLSTEIPEIEVTLPSGKVETLSLRPEGHGTAVGTLDVQEPGLYRVSDGKHTALAAAGSLNPLELADVRSTDAAMRPIVEESGGAIMRVASESLPQVRKVRPGRDRSGRGWIGVLANENYVVTGVDQVPLLPAALVLLLALGGAMLAWHREGR